jgi:hypothetical protein
MGADYFAIIGCPLQTKLTSAGFCARLKMRIQLDGLEQRRSEVEQAAGRKLEDIVFNRGGTNNPTTSMTYGEMRALADEVHAIPECASCRVSSGKPLGCYRYVTYPVDTRSEELLFEYFAMLLEQPRPQDFVGKDPTGKQYTAADLLYQFVIEPLQGDTNWHDQRGAAEAGGLAERAEPLSRTLASRGGKTLDSAQVLQAAFTPIDGAPALQLLAHFHRGFVSWASEQDGAAKSRTFAELRALGELLLAAGKGLKDGPVDVVVDS